MSWLDKPIWVSTLDDPRAATARDELEEAVPWCQNDCLIINPTPSQIADSLLAKRPTLAKALLACLVRDVLDKSKEK